MPADTDQFDLFISYARADNEKQGDSPGFVTSFVEALLAEHRRFTGGDPARELRPFFDKEAIITGDYWEHRLYHGVRNSRLFLAFISPRYLLRQRVVPTRVAHVDGYRDRQTHPQQRCHSHSSHRGARPRLRHE